MADRPHKGEIGYSSVERHRDQIKEIWVTQN